MKLLKYLILGLFLPLFSCGSSQFVKNPPFKVNSAYITNWVGGQPGVSGTNVTINYTTSKAIQFDSIYFRNQAEKLQDKSFNNQKIVVGYLSKTKKRDIVIDINPTKEINNNPPNQNIRRFDLKENEAVISYKDGLKTKYFKLKDLKKGEQQPLPSKR